MKIEMPGEVKFIISELENHDYEAFAVGGCIRDSLLGRTPDDWDITTSATPEEVKEIFQRTVDTGIKHGTVTVLIGKKAFEVTTYRIDGAYTDGRHPESVRYSKYLKEDLRRRDFTINAFAYNDECGLRDEFLGFRDLEWKIIRAVGNPEDRFSEDALRMMRAIRFAAQLGFNIELNTYNAIIKMAPNIKKVSAERIQVELTKTLMSDHPEVTAEYAKTGLFVEILPVLYDILSGISAQKTLGLLRYVPKMAIMRYTALLRYRKPQEARAVLRKLKLDNFTVNTVVKLIEHQNDINDVIEENDISVREAINRYGTELLELMFEFAEADGRMKRDYTGLNSRGRNVHLKTIKRLYEEILDRGDCVSLKGLAVNGNDLTELGIVGEKIGETLNWLLHIVMENPALNNKNTLISFVENR
ncbi:MAG: CCA tRNA nucleotidyltransferase [Lachnospiraceae bacterium]|nr:CCA tRNA nucleotidyltransferase [Lachnospiraceae bacterium]